MGFARVGVRGGGSATGWAGGGRGSTFWLWVLRGSGLQRRFSRRRVLRVGDRGNGLRGGGFREGWNRGGGRGSRQWVCGGWGSRRSESWQWVLQGVTTVGFGEIGVREVGFAAMGFTAVGFVAVGLAEVEEGGAVASKG